MRDTSVVLPCPPYPPREPMHAGEWMRSIRAAHRYSYEDFAKFLGVSPELLERWEKKNKLPNNKGRLRTLNAYAREAGLPELAFQSDLLIQGERKNRRTVKKERRD